MGTLLPGEPDKTIPRDAGSLSAGETEMLTVERQEKKKACEEPVSCKLSWIAAQVGLKTLSHGAGSILCTELKSSFWLECS